MYVRRISHLSRCMSAVAGHVLSMLLRIKIAPRQHSPSTPAQLHNGSDEYLINGFDSASDLGIYEGLPSPIMPSRPERSMYRQSSEEYEFVQLFSALEEQTRSLEELADNREIRDPVLRAMQDVTLRGSIKHLCVELTTAYHGLPRYSALRAQYAQRIRDIRPALIS